MAKKKMRVLVIYGGRSGEHEVSLRSAASILRHLDQEKYEILPLGIDKAGKWHLNDIHLIETKASSLPVYAPHRTGESAVPVIPPHPLASPSFDVVFPVMHGPLCEDGSIQGLFELAGLPYVGCNVLSSAMSMDKEVAKRLVEAAGLPVVPSLCIKSPSRVPALYEEIEKRLGGYPVFVKPANLGSSVGVQKVKSPAELKPALENAWKYDVKVLIEKAISAREIEVAVLESLDPEKPPRVSLVGEIIPHHEFYSYEAKYLDEKGAALQIPADLTPDQSHKAQVLAQKIFSLMECEGLARVDLFLDRQSQQFYFNELNTLPGFTSISMYPQLWEASGLSYSKLLDELISLALARHQRRSQLVRDYQSVEG